MLRRIRTRKEENELWEVEVALFLTLENTIQPTPQTTVDEPSMHGRKCRINKLTGFVLFGRIVLFLVVITWDSVCSTCTDV